MFCKWCQHGKQKGQESIYCVLFGIMIHHEYNGCKYFKEKDEGNATSGNRNGVDAAHAEKTGR